jgi:glutamate racemase
MNKIGVFDSGVGGLSVANAIKKSLPDCKIILHEDRKNLPYGNKTPKQLLSFVVPILEDMQREGCQIIVIACNTVTTNIIKELRAKIKIPLLGIEPMVQTAAQKTESGVITVFATPTTLKSDRYAWLKKEYANGIKDRREIIRNTLQSLDAGADVIVLGCTHYHWIEDIIKQIAGDKADVLQPEQAIIRQLKKEIARLA